MKALGVEIWFPRYETLPLEVATSHTARLRAEVASPKDGREVGCLDEKWVKSHQVSILFVYSFSDGA